MNSQIYSLIPEFSLYGHYAFGEMTTKDASNLPFFVWPNGSPCIAANMYMLALLDRPGRSRGGGLSRRGAKGGTIGLYASHISILIRLLWNFCKGGKLSRPNFYFINDDLFSSFINIIRVERLPGDYEQRKRNENTISTIGRTWLDFLYFVGVFYGDDRFVSENGLIRAKRSQSAIRGNGRNRRSVNIEYWQHHSFSHGERIKKRSPVSAADVESLRNSASKAKALSIEINPSSKKSATFIYQRRLCLVAALENTGARRGELALLRIQDVMQAFNESKPMLRLPVLKGDRDAERLVPVTLNFINYLMKHINSYRQSIIKRTLGVKNDHGMFFINAKSGQPLSETTLSNEIGYLASFIGSNSKICAHMFRHRFITNLFITLIDQHSLTDKGNFRNTLLDSEHWKYQIQQWTGHKSRESLDHYIDLAFAMSGDREKSVSSVFILQAQSDFDKAFKALLEDFGDTMTLPQYKREVEKLMQLRDRDIEIAKNRT